MARSRSGQKPHRSVRVAAEAVFTPDGQPRPAVQQALSRAVESQRPLVRANLRRMRRKFPQATPGELAAKLDRDFVNTVTGSGAAIGATAVIPGIGTLVSLGISAGATMMFLEASALYALSIAELHGVHLDDPVRAQTTVMAIMLGEEGTALMQSFAGHALAPGKRPPSNWGTVLGQNIPGNALKSIGLRVQRRFIARLMLRQGGVVIGRLVPFGVGAVIGGAGNLMMGRSVVNATRIAFGPPPLVFRGELSLPLLPAPSLAIEWQRPIKAIKAIPARLPGSRKAHRD